MEYDVRGTCFCPPVAPAALPPHRLCVSPGCLDAHWTRPFVPGCTTVECRCLRPAHRYLGHELGDDHGVACSTYVFLPACCFCCVASSPVVCIPWMSRRSLDTAIRPWMYYCSVPLPSTKTCLAGVSTRTSSHAGTSPSLPAAGLSRSPNSPAALLREDHVPTAWRCGDGRVFERPMPSRKTGDDDE